MTPDQVHRKQAFDTLYEAIPADRNKQRIDRVCEILFCQPNTVRIWRMRNPTRVIPDSKLKMLQRALGG